MAGEKLANRIKPFEFEAEKGVYAASLTRPLARVLSILFGCIFFGLVVTPWVQTSHGEGRVIAYHPNDREQTIDSPLDGRIVEWFVVEGSRVKEGDPILRIADFDPAFLERLQTEKDAIEKRLNAAELATKTSKINLERQKKLFEEGLRSRRDYESANLEYANYLASEANIAAELARVDVRLARQQNQMVRAPRDGTISRVVVSQGSEIIKAGDSLAIIVPDTDFRAVELWINGLDMPLVTEGRHVRLQFEGWPAIQFSGWPSVAIGTFGGVIANVDPIANGRGRFRVLILPAPNEPWPEPRFLRQGVRAYGWVQLDTVRLGYELWRQFNGFPPSLGENSAPLLEMTKSSDPKAPKSENKDKGK